MGQVYFEGNSAKFASIKVNSLIPANQTKDFLKTG